MYLNFPQQCRKPESIRILKNCEPFLNVGRFFKWMFLKTLDLVQKGPKYLNFMRK